MTEDPYVLETVRWREGAVRVLDQTRLPVEEVYLDLRTPEEVIAAIARLAVRGAPAIGVAGALGLVLAARRTSGEGAGSTVETWVRAVREEGERIAAARPTAVNLRWAVERVLDVLDRRARDGKSGIDSLRASALEEAEEILAEDLRLSSAMAAHGADLLPAEGRVVTHCNTGGLATAGGGTALGVVFEAVRRGARLFVYVDETRPLLQGARLTAWELSRAGIPYAVQCDGAAAWLMRQRRIDAVLVGADRVARNGDTANKVGTYCLALAAREHSVPFYVVAPRSSFDLSLPAGEAIPIEEREAGEVLTMAGRRMTPEGAAAYNPAFDVTPARLIRGWVTERGVEGPPFAP